MATKKQSKTKKYEVIVSFSDINERSYISYALGQIVEMDSKLAKRYKKFIKPYVEEEVK